MPGSLRNFYKLLSSGFPLDTFFSLGVSSCFKRQLLLLPIIFLAACNTVTLKPSEDLVLSPNETTIVLMPLDVELSILTASGLQEPQAEWTANAKEYIADSIARSIEARKLILVDLKSSEMSADSELLQLTRVHEAIGYGVMVHELGVQPLPTKKGRVLDWSLGEKARLLKQQSGADYALFVFVRDSYASGGRVAAMVVGGILGVGVSGGVQIGFASLVDLETGNLVWFNRLVSGSGDLREPLPAQKTVTSLLNAIPSS